MSQPSLSTSRRARLRELAAREPFDYRSTTTFLLSRLQRHLRTELVEAMAQFDVAFAEFVMMNFVRAAEPVTNAELARVSRVTPQSTSRIVARLHERGILERWDGGGSQPVVMTDEGIRLHDQLLEIEEQVLARLSGGSAQWQAELNDALTQAVARLEHDEHGS